MNTARTGRLGLGAFAAALLGACTGFHQIRPGVFRSPQPDEAQLTRRIDDHDLRTVVCLRSGTLTGPVSRSRRATEQAGATFVEIAMSATRPPRPEALRELWRAAATAERPLLLHCRAGVDRTGLAAAIFVLHDTGDLAAARAQLGMLWYGHLSWTRTGAMDDVLDAYEEHAATMSFPQWIDEVYAKRFAPEQPLERLDATPPVVPPAASAADAEQR